MKSPLMSEEVVSKYCCEAMKDQLTYECSMHPDLTCPDIVIAKRATPSPWYESDYTLWGRNAEYTCSYCPFCGTDLRRKDEPTNPLP